MSANPKRAHHDLGPGGYTVEEYDKNIGQALNCFCEIVKLNISFSGSFQYRTIY